MLHCLSIPGNRSPPQFLLPCEIKRFPLTRPLDLLLTCVLKRFPLTSWPKMMLTCVNRPVLRTGDSRISKRTEDSRISKMGIILSGWLRWPCGEHRRKSSSRNARKLVSMPSRPDVQRSMLPLSPKYPHLQTRGHRCLRKPRSVPGDLQS